MQDKITLTEEEQALFDTLLAAAEFAGTKTVLRAAGGWVRDKLLGKDSADIDIALDNMLGKTFADKVGHHHGFTRPIAWLPANKYMFRSHRIILSASP
jgi:hypothetical protein